MKRIGYIISPKSFSKKEYVKDFVASKKQEGWSLTFPAMDETLNDSTGYESMISRKHNITTSDKVFIFWDGDSLQTVFELGMAFALNKEIEIVELPPMTDGRSIQNMVEEWYRRSGISRGSLEDNELH